VLSFSSGPVGDRFVSGVRFEGHSSRRGVVVVVMSVLYFLTPEDRAVLPVRGLKLGFFLPSRGLAFPFEVPGLLRDPFLVRVRAARLKTLIRFLVDRHHSRNGLEVSSMYFPVLDGLGRFYLEVG